MKTKKNTSKKFNLEKFEVAKLKNLHIINGGEGKVTTGNDLPTFTDTSKNCANCPTVNV